MKIAFEIIGIFIVSALLMAIPILCTLSFVYNWFGGLNLILIVACFVEYFGLMNLLSDIGNKQD